MRHTWFILMVVLALASVLGIWVYSYHVPVYIALSCDYRGPNAERAGGVRAWGFYAAQGRIGFLYHYHTWGFLEPGVPAVPRAPTRVMWEHAEDVHQGITIDELGYLVAYSGYGLTLYEGNDGGMGHDQRFVGGLVQTRMVALFLALFLGVTLWRRLRHRSGEPSCATCGYDIRTQAGGAAGSRCPECGTVIAPDQPPSAHGAPNPAPHHRPIP